jgi:hypothetical protein
VRAGRLAAEADGAATNGASRLSAVAATRRRRRTRRRRVLGGSTGSGFVAGMQVVRVTGAPSGSQVL